MAPLFTDLPTSYSVGTATVAANGTAVTGQGTVWLDSLRVGDLFGTHKGFAVRIAAIASNTSLTLAYEWPGAAQTAAAYEIQLTPRSVGVQEATRQLLTLLANGNLSGLAGLTTAADKIAYFTGVGGATALADFNAAARALLAGTGVLPNSQLPASQTGKTFTSLSTMTGLNNNGSLFINTNGTTLSFQRNNADSVDIEAFLQGGGPKHRIDLNRYGGGVTINGRLVFERGSNANGEYVRFGDGTQICTMNRVFTGSGAGIRTITLAYPISFSSKPQLYGAANYLASGFRYLGPTTATEPGLSSATSVGIEVTNGGLGNLFCEMQAIGRWF